MADRCVEIAQELPDVGHRAELKYGADLVRDSRSTAQFENLLARQRAGYNPRLAADPRYWENDCRRPFGVAQGGR
jgi:hypothetical protein